MATEGVKDEERGDRPGPPETAARALEIQVRGVGFGVGVHARRAETDFEHSRQVRGAKKGLVVESRRGAAGTRRLRRLDLSTRPV